MHPIEVDNVSLLATCEAHVKWADLEAFLKEKGYTLGCRFSRGGSQLTVRQAFERGLKNIYAAKYGEFHDLCVAVEAQRRGAVLVTKNVPRSATGPDFKKILIGSRGAYGRIQRATFRMVPLPKVRKRVAVSWKTESQGRDWRRQVAASGILPAVLELRSRSATLQLAGTTPIVRAELACLKKICRRLDLSLVSAWRLVESISEKI